MYVWGQKGPGKSLYLPLNFDVNQKMSLESKVYMKMKNKIPPPTKKTPNQNKQRNKPPRKDKTKLNSTSYSGGVNVTSTED